MSVFASGPKPGEGVVELSLQGVLCGRVPREVERDPA